MTRITYGVTGMHCASCEAIIEKRVKKLDGVIDAKADMTTGTLTISCEKAAPELTAISRLFPESLYLFSETHSSRHDWTETIRVTGYSLAVIGLFFGLSASGIMPSLSIDRDSSFGAFFVFGLIAGLSTCAALVGSLVLALSTQWRNHAGKKATITDKLQPHLWFGTGRIASYALTGTLLGLLGGSVRLSSGFTSVMVVAISILMLAIALQMIGFRPLNVFRISLPKRLVDKAGSGISRGGLLRPFPTGFMTILLPCGFTMAAEAAAMLSGTPLRGMVIMTAFALGTLPPLFAIGLSGSELSGRPATSRSFMKTAGFLVIFFTLYNLNTQFGIAGRIAARNASPATPVSAPATGNTRIVRTVASNGSLATAQFELKAGEQVRFIVDPKDNGSGCMNAILIPGLWNQAQYLSKGRPIVMQFTPRKRGTYQITCAMGMPWGSITVK